VRSIITVLLFPDCWGIGAFGAATGTGKAGFSKEPLRTLPPVFPLLLGRLELELEELSDGLLLERLGLELEELERLELEELDRPPLLLPPLPPLLLAKASRLILNS